MTKRGELKKIYSHFISVSMYLARKYTWYGTLFLRLLLTGNGTGFYTSSSEGKRVSSRLQLGQRN